MKSLRESWLVQTCSTPLLHNTANLSQKQTLKPSVSRTQREKNDKNKERQQALWSSRWRAHSDRKPVLPVGVIQQHAPNSHPCVTHQNLNRLSQEYINHLLSSRVNVWIFSFTFSTDDDDDGGFGRQVRGLVHCRLSCNKTRCTFVVW